MAFVVELLRRLRRLNRVHHPILVGECDQVAWGYFLRVARDFCKLTLARYVFRTSKRCLGKSSARSWSPKVPRIRFPCTVSNRQLGGHGNRLMPPFRNGASRQAMRRPQYLLGFGTLWLWELNSLVEYPLTSAGGETIKPPGSTLEIEIKRAGTRGPRLLDVIAEQNGHEAPISHRLYGGSLAR